MLLLIKNTIYNYTKIVVRDTPAEEVVQPENKDEIYRGSESGAWGGVGGRLQQSICDSTTYQFYQCNNYIDYLNLSLH